MPIPQDESSPGGKGGLSPSGGSPASVRRQWRPYLLPAVLLAAAVPALAVDCPLSQWCLEDDFPGELRNLFQTCEPFGDGLGVLVIALAIHQLDRARRCVLPRILICSWGAGLAANVIKLLVVRVRPGHFDFEGNVWTTFDGWLPLISAGHAGQSFPSAHTATAAGLAMALIWLYPGGRWLFPTLAVLVAAQRIESGAHFLSDVLFGAALGIIVATACLKTGWLPKWFDRLEEDRNWGQAGIRD
jgi:membrane-associated phospholipid phosphatase